MSIPAVPSVPRSADAETKRFLEAVKTILEVRALERGPRDERFVTRKDLVDAGLSELQAPNITNVTEVTEVIREEYVDNSTPIQPTNVRVDGTFSRTILHWSYTGTGRVAYFEIYRGKYDPPPEDPAQQVSPPLLADASNVGTSQSSVFVDANVQQGEKYRYWVRGVNAGNYGPYSSPVDVEVSSNPLETLAEISGGISQNMLTQDLLTAITSEPETVTLPDNMYVLRLNTDGKIVGFGLATDSESSTFAIVADQFLITDPDNSATSVTPFVVQDNKVYINTATIGDASISSAMIESLSADKLSVTGNIASPFANLGTVTSGLIKSADNQFVIDLANKSIFIGL